MKKKRKRSPLSIVNCQLSIATAALLLPLLLIAACDSSIPEAEAGHDPQISIGNIAVAGSEALNQITRADGLSPFYEGDELYVTIGSGSISFTYTAHGTWMFTSNVIQLSEAIPYYDANQGFNTSKGGGFRFDQSDWKWYHAADGIGGSLHLDQTTGQLYTKSDAPLAHINTDVVILICTPKGTANKWKPGEFRQHISSAKIEVHSPEDLDGKGGPDRYTPWLASIADVGSGSEAYTQATLRLQMVPHAVPASGSTLITITPADGSNPITGTCAYTEYDKTGNTKNQRLEIIFADYENKRSLGSGTATVIPWTDGGTEELID